MNISAFSNAYHITQSRMAIENQQSRVDGFQSALEAAIAKEDDKALKKACLEFESYFLYVMFKEMRKTINRTNDVLYSHTEELFQGLLDEEYGKSLSRAGGIGLADMMYRQMRAQQATVAASTTD